MFVKEPSIETSSAQVEFRATGFKSVALNRTDREGARSKAKRFAPPQDAHLQDNMDPCKSFLLGESVLQIGIYHVRADPEPVVRHAPKKARREKTHCVCRLVLLTTHLEFLYLVDRSFQPDSSRFNRSTEVFASGARKAWLPRRAAPAISKLVSEKNKRRGGLVFSRGTPPTWWFSRLGGWAVTGHDCQFCANGALTCLSSEGTKATA